MSGKKGMKDYPVEIKLEAMRLYYEEGKTQAQVTAVLGIRDPARITKWIRRYRREGASGFSRPRGRPRKEEQSELDRLRMEVALLKKFHSELREVQLAQRNIGFSTTIEKTST
jgi:transposase